MKPPTYFSNDHVAPVVAATPEPPGPSESDLLCYDPSDESHQLIAGGILILVLCVLGLFCINCYRATSLYRLEVRQNEASRDTARALQSLRQDIAGLRRDLQQTRFQETEDTIDRILSRVPTPLFHQRDFPSPPAWRPGSWILPSAPPQYTEDDSAPSATSSPARQATADTTMAPVPPMEVPRARAINVTPEAIRRAVKDMTGQDVVHLDLDAAAEEATRQARVWALYDTYEARPCRGAC